MAKKPSGGFTLVELILFLALSGLFLLIALNGVSGRSGQVQFTDSMRSLSSFLQRQYSDTINGVNVRDGSLDCNYGSGNTPSTTGTEDAGRSECTIMGKVVVFSDDSDQAETYVIVGRFLTQTVDSGHPNYLDPTLSDVDLINAADPAVLLSDLNQIYDLEWQTKFLESNSDQTAIAFIRSPRSSSIYPITLSPTWSGDPAPLDVSNISANARYCFEGLNGQDAEIIIGGTNRSDGVELEFDTGCS